MPAIGFSVKTDYLLDAVPEIRTEKRRLVYPKAQLREALQYAEILRKDGPVELVPDENAREMEVKG